MFGSYKVLYCLFSTVGLFALAGCSRNAATPAANTTLGAAQSTPSKDGGVATAPKSQELAFKGKAEDLFKQFKDLESLNANLGKYKDKLVEVEGVVDEAPLSGPGQSMKMSLTWMGKPGIGSVSCTMSPEAAKTFRELGKGQKVKITGKLTLAIVNFVFLDDCSYKAEGPNPALRVTAKDLGKEFSTDDGEAAAKKYNGKELIVEGTVLNVNEKGGLFMRDMVVDLDSGLTEPMHCTFAPADNEDFKQIKKGDKVILKGMFLDNVVAMKHYPSISNVRLVKKN